MSSVEYPLRGLQNREQLFAIYRDADCPPRWMREAVEQEIEAMKAEISEQDLFKQILLESYFRLPQRVKEEA